MGRVWLEDGVGGWGGERGCMDGWGWGGRVGSGIGGRCSCGGKGVDGNGGGGGVNDAVLSFL